LIIELLKSSVARPNELLLSFVRAPWGCPSLFNLKAVALSSVINPEHRSINIIAIEIDLFPIISLSTP